MLVVNAYVKKIAQGIAALVDPFHPAPGSENYVILFKNNVVIGPDTVMADLTEPTFDDYTAIACAAGAAAAAVDPISNAWEIRPPEPNGGFSWIVGGDTDLPQTIYGWALVNHAKTALIAAENFAAPLQLTAQDQVVDVPQPIGRLAYSPVT